MAKFSTTTTTTLFTTHLRPTPSTSSASASPSFLRNSLSSPVRHATFIPRPRRPYTFTQLVQLSDGSTYTARTTSPLPLYRAAKDTRNTLLWQPSEKSLRNVELDEAGKLAAFRERFGRVFDAPAAAAAPVEGETAAAEAEGKKAEDEKAAATQEDAGLNFEDLLAEFKPQDTGALKDSGPKKAPTRRK
ncbi:hypothetical protein MKX07_004586 [Trichoderma sp. CBMAI-0711]|uniref:Ribosomal protein bL31m N-terminal domain-containing protein n=1 Tax=Trichoderma parareesei TaxID=858221 RepID=A0A2H2ZBX2_TRIPA|nr:hypothetical protein MKX07_004586 [Trichoderma sp. CBMAI-0711]OTA01030.1 hypothetical protein A9Z42_0013290 [Trichoderma parareesei]